MDISLSLPNQISNQDDQNNRHDIEMTKTPNLIEIGSPLTPVDKIDLSIPPKPVSRQRLFHENDDLSLMEYNLDELFYDSDGNAPPETTIGDSFHVEHEIKNQVAGVVQPISDATNIIIIDDATMDKLKVRELKQELQKRGLLYLGKRSELREHLGRAMVNKILIIHLAASAATSTGFDTNARWRLLAPTIEVNEPINIDPTFVILAELDTK